MPMVRKYPSEVASVREMLPGVFSVEFKSLDRPYRYDPGQFLHLALDPYDPSAPWPESRCFSMQTADKEPNIRITYAVKGGYTGRMQAELKPGAAVTLKLPYGEIFTRPHSPQDAVFIAGGTGVTPFLSLFNSPRFATYFNPRLWLGIRDAGFHFYQKELELAKSINPSFRAEIVCQDKDGMLDVSKIRNANRDGKAWFLSGPPVMIKNFRAWLLQNGVAADAVITDDWE